MAGYKISLFIFSSLLCFNVWAADKAYQCISETQHITLQDKPCPQNAEQSILPLVDFSKTESDDGLRPMELTALERYHQLDVIQKRYDNQLRNDLANARVNQENAVEYQELLHEQAKEMFDLNYRHYWFYDDVNGSFPYSYGLTTSPYGYGLRSDIVGFGD